MRTPPPINAKFRVKSFTHYFHDFPADELDYVKNYNKGVFTVRKVMIDNLVEPHTWSVVSDEIGLIHHQDDIELVIA